MSLSSSPVKRCLLVGNPTAQSGRNAARIERAQALLGTLHDFQATLPAGETVAAVAAALRSADYDTVIAMGGDGTFAEVAKGLMASGRAETVRLAMLPTGTANDQGKSFGLQSDEASIERNVGVALAGHETRLDVGKIRALQPDGSVFREDYFFDSAGWGISPRILHARNDDRKLIESVPLLGEIYRDHAVYAGALFRTFFQSYLEPEQFAVTATIDGVEQKFDRLCDLVVKATRIYGGIWVLEPSSKHDDGVFEVVPFASRRDWLSKALVHLDHTGKLHERLDNLGVGPSHGMAGAKISLEFHLWPGAQPLVAQIDGEEFPTTTRAEIEVLARAIRLIVPSPNS